MENTIKEVQMCRKSQNVCPWAIMANNEGLIPKEEGAVAVLKSKILLMGYLR